MPKRAWCQVCEAWSGIELAHGPGKGRVYCRNTWCMRQIHFARPVDVEQADMDQSVAEARKRFNAAATR